MEKSKRYKYSILVKNTALFTISSLGSKFISFFLIPLYTYVLSTEEYGMIDLLASTSSLLIPVLTLNIQDAVIRFALDDEYDSSEVITTALKVNAFGMAVVLVSLLCLKCTNILQLDDVYIIFLFFNYTLGALQNSFTLYLKGKEHVETLVVSGLTQTFLVCVLNVLFLLIFKWGINGYLLASILGQLVAIIINFYLGKIYLDIRFVSNRKISKAMISYSYPLVFNSLAWWINNASDRYILTFLCGVSANGIYSMAYKIPTMLATIQNVFYNAWSISAIKEFNEQDDDGFIGHTYELYSFCSLIVCSIIMCANIYISKILYSKEFFEAWICVPFLLVGTAFNGMALFEGCIFTAVKKTKEVSKTTIIGSVINTICNFVFICIWGTIGAAGATMLGYLVTWGIRTIWLRKIIHIRVNWYKHLVSCGLLILQTIAAIQSVYIYQIVIILILLLLNKRYLVTLYRTVIQHRRSHK